MREYRLPRSLEEALSNEETEAWDRRIAYGKKIDRLSHLVYTGGFVIFIGSLVAATEGAPLCIAGNLISIPAGLWALNKLEELDHQYWRKNWADVYRSYRDPQPQIVEGEFKP